MSQALQRTANDAAAKAAAHRQPPPAPAKTPPSLPSLSVYGPTSTTQSAAVPPFAPKGGSPAVQTSTPDSSTSILMKAKQIASRIAEGRANAASIAQPFAIGGAPSAPYAPSATASAPIPLSIHGPVPTPVPYSPPSTKENGAGKYQTSATSLRDRSRSPERRRLGYADRARHDRRSPPSSYRAASGSRHHYGYQPAQPYEYPGGYRRDVRPVVEEDKAISFYVPEHFISEVIGHAGEMQRAISKISGARVDIAPAPSGHHREYLVSLTGSSMAISKANGMIDDIIRDPNWKSRRDRSPSLGHFARDAPRPGLHDHVPLQQQQSSASYGYGGSHSHQPRLAENESYHPELCEMSIYVPNSKVGIIIGRGGDTIRDLQDRSGTRIEVTPDAEHDRRSDRRLVRLIGTRSACGRAKMLIDDLIEAVTGSRTGEPAGTSSRFDAALKSYSTAVSTAASARAVGDSPPSRDVPIPSTVKKITTEIVYVPIEFAGLVIGKGGETVRHLEGVSGARITMDNGEVINGKRPIRLIGTASHTAHARDLIMKTVEEDPSYRSSRQSRGGEVEDRQMSRSSFRPESLLPASPAIPRYDPADASSGYGTRPYSDRDDYRLFQSTEPAMRPSYLHAEGAPKPSYPHREAATKRNYLPAECAPKPGYPPVDGTRMPSYLSSESKTRSSAAHYGVYGPSSECDQRGAFPPQLAYTTACRDPRIAAAHMPSAVPQPPAYAPSPSLAYEPTLPPATSASTRAAEVGYGARFLTAVPMTEAAYVPGPVPILRRERTTSQPSPYGAPYGIPQAAASVPISVAYHEQPHYQQTATATAPYAYVPPGHGYTGRQ